jgi:hypothetical protein
MTWEGKMKESENRLVQCPKCGNVQDRFGQCVKCGNDITLRSAGEEIPPKEESCDNAETHDAPEARDITVTGKFTLASDSPQSRKTPPPHEQSRSFYPAQPPATEDDGPAERALVPIFMPIGRLIALSIITFCVYQIFWFHRNWKILKYYHDRWLQPGKLTLMMLIPFYGIYLVYRQLNGIREMTAQRAMAFPVIPVLIGWIALFGWIIIAYLLDTGFLLFSLWLGSVFLFIPVQRSLNALARNSGHTEPSSGSRKVWMAAAMAVVALFLAGGIIDTGMHYRVMRPFEAETAELDAASASTNSETRELLVRYGSYIERSRRLINARGLRKSDRYSVYNETTRLINDLPRKLHCVTRGEAAGIQHSMVKFINENNQLRPQILADLSVGLAEIQAVMEADLPGSSGKQGLEQCASEPFDLKAFIEEMKQAKGGSAQQSGQNAAAAAAPAPQEDSMVVAVKAVSALLKAHYQKTGTISNDALFLLQNYGDQSFRSGRSAVNPASNFIHRKAVSIKSEGNTYRIGIEHRLGTNNKGEPISKWVVCSGTAGGSETIETINQAPSGTVP